MKKLESMFSTLATNYGEIGFAVVLLFTFHKQAMAKFDEQKLLMKDLVKSIQTLSSSYERHSVELEHTAKEFERIEVHQKLQDKHIHTIRNTLHKMGNTMVTHEHLRDLAKELK